MSRRGLAPRSLLGTDLVAERGGPFVIFFGDSLVKLFTQCLFQRKLLANLLLVEAQLINEREVGRVCRLVFVPPDSLMGCQPLNSVAQGVDRLFGTLSFECDRDGSLSTMEQDDTTELLVRADVIFVLHVTANEIHEGDGVVGVVNGILMPAQGQPGDAPMVKLNEFTVGLGALVGRHHPGRRLALRREPSAGGVMPEVIEVGHETVRAEAIGAPADLELKDAELDTHL